MKKITVNQCVHAAIFVVSAFMCVGLHLGNSEETRLALAGSLMLALLAPVFVLLFLHFVRGCPKCARLGQKKITKYSAPKDLEYIACVHCGHVFWERSISERFISQKFSEFACPECSSFDHRYTGTSLPKGKNGKWNAFVAGTCFRNLCSDCHRRWLN